MICSLDLENQIMPGISNLKRQFDKNISELKYWYLFPKENLRSHPIPYHKNTNHHVDITKYGVGTIFTHIHVNILNNYSPQNVLIKYKKQSGVHVHMYEVDRLQSIVHNNGIIHLYIFPYFKKIKASGKKINLHFFKFFIVW